MVGNRVYDESKVALVAGAVAGIGLALTGASTWFASTASLFTWGIGLPMTAAGLLTRYLPQLRAQWAAFWQQREQQG